MTDKPHPQPLVKRLADRVRGDERADDVDDGDDTQAATKGDQ